MDQPRSATEQISQLPLRWNQRQALLAINYWTNHCTGESFPSLSRLARDLGFSRRGLQYMLRRLERDGYMQTIPRVRPHTCRQTSNGYRLRCVNHQEASQARVKNGSTSCTPLKVSKTLKEGKEKYYRLRDLLSLKVRNRRERSYAGEMESSRFRAVMAKVWKLTGTFLQTPRADRKLLAWQYMKEAQKSQAYRFACARLRLNWQARRGTYNKKSPSRRVQPTSERREVNTPWGNVTERTGGWSSASVSSSASLGLRDY